MVTYKDDYLVPNTFGVAARCKRFVEYGCTLDAIAVAGLLRTVGEPFMIVGRGSNLLLTRDYEGVVVHCAMRGIEQRGEVLRVGAGAMLDDVIAFALSSGLYGLENLSLIPSEVGASAVQNVGAYGCEVSDVIDTIEAVEIDSGLPRVFVASRDCDYGYRYSRFKGEWRNKYLITHVSYRLSRTFRPNLSYGNILERLSDPHAVTPEALRSTIIAIRREKLPDPDEVGNAGSFFTNPIVSVEAYERLRSSFPDIVHFDVGGGRVKLSAAWMIERCGWRGKALGRAAVHEGQALVIVNRGGASGAEVVHLANAIIDDVRATFGITLSPEVNII